MAPMNVTLTPDLERLVHERVATGQYRSAVEVIREALRLLKERDVAFKELQRDIAAGVEQLDRGEAEVLDIAAIKAKARQQMS
jgi:antitoxin ParD1/3/4